MKFSFLYALCMMSCVIVCSDNKQYKNSHGPFSYDCWNIVLEYLPVESSYFYYGVRNRDITNKCAAQIVVQFIDFCQKLARSNDKNLIYEKMKHICLFYKTVTPQTSRLLIKYFKEYGSCLMRHLALSPICEQQLQVLAEPSRCAVLCMFLICKPVVQRAYPDAFWLLLPGKVQAADIQDRLLDSTSVLCCTPFGQTRFRLCCPVLWYNETLLTSCLACLFCPFFFI